MLKAYLSSLNSDAADDGGGDRRAGNDAGGNDNNGDGDDDRDGDDDDDDDEDDAGAGGLNSDSGVHEGGSTPDGDAGGCSSSASNGQVTHVKQTAKVLAKTTTATTDVDSGNGGSGGGAATQKKTTTLFPLGRRLRPKSKRESELLWHHRNHQQKIAAAAAKEQELQPIVAGASGDRSQPAVADSSNLDDHIEWLEKIIVINKQLQREEELIVRLNAKLSKSVHNDPNLSLQQLTSAIGTVNTSLEFSTAETDRVQREVDITNAILGAKQEAIEQLSWELKMFEAEPKTMSATAVGSVGLVAVDGADLGFMQMGTLV